MAFLRNALAGLMIIASPAPASTVPMPADPVGKWVLDYGEAGCTLSRTFGDPAKPMILGFVPVPFGEKVRVVLITPDRPKGPGLDKGTIEFGAPQTKHETPVEIYPSAAGGWSVVAGADQGALLQALEVGQVLTLNYGRSRVSLNVGQNDKAVAALRSCLGDLLAGWGMDKAAQALVASPPGGNVVAFFRADDYPASALEGKEQGDVAVRYWVEPDGRVADCRVVMSSGSELLDSTTCTIITERARLTPARDKDGKPVRSLTATTIHWIIPTG